MEAIHIRSALAVTSLALALTGCGPAESQPTQRARGDGASTSGKSSGDQEEPITPGGVAAVVREHLGPETVRQFVTYEQEPGSVSVMVRLRDATPHNFAVQVHSPEQAEMYGEARACRGSRRSGSEVRCRTLDDGTTLMTIRDAHGFSDDNADGMVLSGSTTTPDNGGAMAMYESYDDSPAITVADIEKLLTDPRLGWLTDPAVNEAGADIPVKALE